MIRSIKDLVIKLWCLLSGIIVIALVICIFLYIFVKGFGVVNLGFILGKPQGMPIGAEGGIFPAIIGSIYLVLISCTIASVLGIGTAIYISFYCKDGRIKGFIRIITECTSGIPSIVLGLFGYTLFVMHLGLGRSILSGGITLGIMIFPFIEIRAEKALREVPRDIINSSYALGISKVYTIFKIVLPAAKRDLIPAITLSGGFSIGAAAPIIFTSAVIVSPIPKSIMDPSMALPYHLYVLIGEGISMEMAYGTAFVLMFLLIIINSAAVLYASRRER
jgi:phosphate transport system permease protein